MALAYASVLVAAVVTTGLVAGLFFAFTFAVMRGLGRTDDVTAVHAMRAINAAILNGWFLSIFIGTPVLLVIAALLTWSAFPAGALPTLLVALGCYLATLVITGRVHVPLNMALAAAGVDTAADLRRARAGFERPWVWWNMVRTSTSVAAFVAVATSLVLQ
ncbi:MAG TPA: anthrone oxygenase family protein [Beutenbergiaceae bacterium]|nr:anthrone oxygenase family protein [Beutenbergiaceae bacterium]